MGNASTMVEEFIQALEEEIRAIKTGRGGGVVKLFNGRFVRQAADFFIYIFHLENFLVVLEDSPAEIEIHGRNYHAQVLSTRSLEVEIGLDQSFGPHVAEARLKTNLWYLLELLKKKFLEVKEVM